MQVLKYFFTILLMVSFMTSISQDLSKYPKKLVKPFEEARQSYINKDYPAALDAINGLIEKNKFFTEAYLLKADILHEMGQPGPEADCLEQVLANRFAEISQSLLSCLASALKKTGEYANAKQRTFCDLLSVVATCRHGVDQ